MIIALLILIAACCLFGAKSVKTVFMYIFLGFVVMMFFESYPITTMIVVLLGICTRIIAEIMEYKEKRGDRF